MSNKRRGRKLSRRTNPRQALFRSLVRELVLHGQIKTSLAKAKAVTPQINKIFNLVKKDSVAARRQVLAKLGNDKETTSLLFGKYLPLAKSRPSGFVRITLIGTRRGDSTQMAEIALLPVPEPKTKKAKQKSKTKPKKKTKK